MLLKGRFYPSAIKAVGYMERAVGQKFSLY